MEGKVRDIMGKALFGIPFKDIILFRVGRFLFGVWAGNAYGI